MVLRHNAYYLFHRNLDRILTHFGDNQRLGYGIRGSTVGCNRRAKILAVSSEELHHLTIVKTREADDAIMSRSHHAPCSYLVDVGTNHFRNILPPILGMTSNVVSSGKESSFLYSPSKVQQYIETSKKIGEKF